MSCEIKYCPKCTSTSIDIIENRKLHCNDCDLVYYQNVAAATAVILRKGDEILFTIRNREPQKGKLDLPGGFVDPDESAEEGAQRELKEELNIDLPLSSFQYFMSKPNNYEYKNVLYKTCDLAFIATFPENEEIAIEEDEITAIKWVKINGINLDEIGFDSLRFIVEQFVKQNT